ATVLLGEVDTLKAEFAALKREKGELLADVKDAIVATEETMRAQALVLAPGVDVSVMGLSRLSVMARSSTFSSFLLYFVVLDFEDL
ncbi:hypothetical protein HN873_051547, partial [Arachis hypogaea]